MFFIPKNLDNLVVTIANSIRNPNHYKKPYENKIIFIFSPDAHRN